MWITVKTIKEMFLATTHSALLWSYCGIQRINIETVALLIFASEHTPDQSLKRVDLSFLESLVLKVTKIKSTQTQMSEYGFQLFFWNHKKDLITSFLQ